MIIVIFDEEQHWLATIKWSSQQSIQTTYSPRGEALIRPSIDTWTSEGIPMLVEQHTSHDTITTHEVGIRRVPFSAKDAQNAVRVWASTHQLISIPLSDGAETPLNRILTAKLTPAETFLLVQALFHTPAELQSEWDQFPVS